MSRDTRNELDATPRRGFIGRLVAGGAALVAAGSPHQLLHATTTGDATEPRGAAQRDWMDELTGKHRTVFDVAAHKNGKPLAQAVNYLNAWRDAFKVPEGEINLVVGIHGEAIPIVLGDALWTRFKIGEQYEVTSAATRAAATENVFTAMHASSGGLVAPGQTIDALQQRGARFIVCNNTVAAATKKLEAAGFGTAGEIRPALLAGLLPGVVVVPAMVVALTQLQERGVKYTKIA
jgi:intracellular sulfur oxidation DsrE/DsrF family protein